MNLLKNKEKKESRRKLIILLLIVLVTVVIVMYFCRWYKVYDEYQKQTPVIRDTLLEIVSDDLEPYLVENPTTIVYMCTASDMKCRDFEKNFIKYIEKKDLYDEFVYLNLSDQDLKVFSKEFNKKYNCKGKFKPNYPAFVSFEEGVVKNILQEEDNKLLDIDTVDSFVELTREEDPYEYE